MPVHGLSDARTSNYIGLTTDITASKSAQMQNVGMFAGVDHGAPNGLGIGGELEFRYNNINAPNMKKSGMGINDKFTLIPRISIMGNPDGEGISANASAGIKYKSPDLSFQGLEGKANVDLKGIWMASHCAEQTNRHWFIGATSKFETFTRNNNNKDFNLLRGGVHVGLQQDKSNIGVEAGYLVKDLAFEKAQPYVGVSGSIALGNF